MSLNSRLSRWPGTKNGRKTSRRDGNVQMPMRLTAELSRTTVLTLGLLLGGLAPAMAQNPRPADAAGRPAASVRAAEAAIDVSKLPIDMNRIRRKLAGVT